MKRYVNPAPVWLAEEEAAPLEGLHVILPEGPSGTVLLVHARGRAAPYVVIGQLELHFLTQRAIDLVRAGQTDLRDRPDGPSPG